MENRAEMLAETTHNLVLQMAVTQLRFLLREQGQSVLHVPEYEDLLRMVRQSRPWYDPLLSRNAVDRKSTPAKK